MSGRGGRTWPENAWPTAEQYLDWLLTLDREQQLERIGSRLLDAEHAQRCVMRNHDGLEDEVQRWKERWSETVADANAQREIVGRVKVLAEDGFGFGYALPTRQLRAALNPRAEGTSGEVGA